MEVKQRDLTLVTALEAANASAAEQPPDAQASVVPTKHWDASKGNATTVMAPNKMQKRKHQINTLAAAAKAATSSMMAMKAHAVSSKRAAASKYGW
jgi:hypothetical protein